MQVSYVALLHSMQWQVGNARHAEVNSIRTTGAEYDISTQEGSLHAVSEDFCSTYQSYLNYELLQT